MFYLLNFESFPNTRPAGWITYCDALNYTWVYIFLLHV